MSQIILTFATYCRARVVRSWCFYSYLGQVILRVETSHFSCEVVIDCRYRIQVKSSVIWLQSSATEPASLAFLSTRPFACQRSTSHTTATFPTEPTSRECRRNGDANGSTRIGRRNNTCPFSSTFQTMDRMVNVTILLRRRNCHYMTIFS